MSDDGWKLARVETDKHVAEWPVDEYVSENWRILCSASREKICEFFNAAHASRAKVLVDALEKLRDCDWTISLPDRMDAVRKIARDALSAYRGG